VTLIALMIIPLLAYGVVSGDISEFTAPGGWARSSRRGQEEDRAGSDHHFHRRWRICRKGDYVHLESVDKKLVPGKPVAMTLQLGRSGYYQTPVITKYIMVLSQHDPDMSVVVIDPTGKLLPHEGDVVLSLLKDSEQRGRFMSALAGSVPNAILAIGGFSEQIHLATMQAMSMPFRRWRRRILPGSWR